MVKENKMTNKLEEAIRKLSKAPQLTSIDPARVDYNVPKYLIRDVMDDSQREHIQRSMCATGSLIVGEYREDFKY